MKRILLSVFLSFMPVFGVSFNMSEYAARIEAINNATATIKDSNDIIIGSSGVVIHAFGDDESIIARASVIAKDGVNATIRFEVFDMLAQRAFPLPGVAPKVGDIVLLNYLYDRSLIVVPNKDIYEEVVKGFPKMTFIHPDIVGAYLSYEYKPNPSRDDFRKMCAASGAGLIFIGLDGKGVFADCQSFKILKEFKTGEVEYYQLPFYTRVRDIDTIFWKLDAEHINNYDAYYDYLLEQDDK